MYIRYHALAHEAALNVVVASPQDSPMCNVHIMHAVSTFPVHAIAM